VTKRKTPKLDVVPEESSEPPWGADSATGHRSERRNRGTRVAVYPYTDKDGNLVARVCRYEWIDENAEKGKDLPIDSLLVPEPPPFNVEDDRKGKKPSEGGWIYKAPPPAQRPLYRIKKLRDAPVEATSKAPYAHLTGCLKAKKTPILVLTAGALPVQR
jgi:hypothetical protein